MTLFTSLANVVLADANGDGNLDAVISSSGNPAIYLGDGKGALTYDKTLQNPFFLDLAPVMVADLNGDGIPDIGQMCANSFAIFLGKGKGAFESPFYIGAGPSPSDQLIANLHGQPPSAGHEYRRSMGESGSLPRRRNQLVSLNPLRRDPAMLWYTRDNPHDPTGSV
jgi:FG-GAP-like repeat